MLTALEKELYIDINEKSKEKVIYVFNVGKTIQLPVVENLRVVGILDLFVLLGNTSRSININDLMYKDIIVAGEYQNVFSFKNSNQLILPIVDVNGNYIGFVNKFTQKTYLPSKEYMQFVEMNLKSILDEDKEINFDHLKKNFFTIIESNYDGIYITVDKGTTLSINNQCNYIDDTIVESESFSENTVKGEYINVIQNIQKRKEISVSQECSSNRGIIRVSENINDFNQIKSELNEMKKLAKKYQTELEFLRWEQKKTDKVIAHSNEMKKVINLAVRVAKFDTTVLIQGQSGVGKGELSKLIHNNSERKNGPFIKIDCGSIPEHLLESELYGYEPGSFSGAKQEGKIGLIELANEGTLFLDEIGELPLNLQSKILRVLQDKEIVRVGGKKTIPVDIRIIAATNRDLEEMVQQKKFRQDLYFRLNVFPIKILTLQERREDIKPLVENCLNLFNKKYKLNKYVDCVALRYLINYNWPGNVREVENVIEYLIITTDSVEISKEDLPSNIVNHDNNMNNNLPTTSILGFNSMKEAIDSIEKELLIDAMRNSKNTTEMAEILKIDRSTVSRKLKRHNIEGKFN